MESINLITQEEQLALISKFRLWYKMSQHIGID